MVKALEMLRKLSIYGINRNSSKWFESYLSNRSQKCKFNCHLSQAKQITCGVPQGSILGLLLFLIYINHPLPNCLQKAASRMYADDTNITSAASDLNVREREMKSEFKKIKIWLLANK